MPQMAQVLSGQSHLGRKGGSELGGSPVWCFSTQCRRDRPGRQRNPARLGHSGQAGFLEDRAQFVHLREETPSDSFCHKVGREVKITPGDTELRGDRSSE